MIKRKATVLIDSTSLLIQLRRLGYMGAVPNSSSELRELLNYLNSIT